VYDAEFLTRNSIAPRKKRNAELKKLQPLSLKFQRKMKFQKKNQKRRRKRRSLPKSQNQLGFHELTLLRSSIPSKFLKSGVKACRLKSIKDQ